MKKVLALVLALALVMAMSAAAFADGDKLGYTCMDGTNPFFVALEGAIREVVEAHGDTLISLDPQNSNEKQLSQVEDLISQGIKVLFVNPVDRDGIIAALDKVKEAGIPMFGFDTEVADMSYLVTYAGSDNYNAGYVCGADVAEKFAGQHCKILVAHSPRATSCTRRYAGFFAALDEAGADYEIVQEVDGWGDREKSLNAVAPALVADPDIDVIFAINDPSAMGCYDAVEQATVELEKDIKIYGVDGNPDIKVMIKNGQVEGTGSQSPNTLGFDSMVAAFKLLSGEEVEHKIDVDTFLITAENVDEFGTDGWQ